jgi:ATP-dependent DNA helicase RecQ
MEKVGPELLKPVYDDLKKTVDYNELRILQLAYMAQNGYLCVPPPLASAIFS